MKWIWRRLGIATEERLGYKLVELATAVDEDQKTLQTRIEALERIQDQTHPENMMPRSQPTAVGDKRTGNGTTPTCGSTDDLTQNLPDHLRRDR